jgi:microcystin-dependent protein
MPPGAIVSYAGAAAPAGWLLCDGAAVSRTTHADLFAAIGIAYGEGDASTTFNLPNLKGRIPAGRDSSQAEFDTLGETGGAKTVQLTAAQLAAHSHVVNSHSHGGATGAVGDHTHGFVGSVLAAKFGSIGMIQQGAGGVIAFESGGTLGGGAHSHSVAAEAPATNNAGSDQAHNNLQPYLVVNYLIKT